MPGAVGRLFSGGGTVLPALQWGRPPGPRRGLYGGSASVGGLAWQERRAQKGRLMLRIGRCCHCGGRLLGVRGVVVGVFVAPDPSGKGTYKDLSLEMIRKTWRIGRLTPSAAISGCMVDLATGILRDGQLSGLRVIRQTDVTRTSPDRSVPGAKYIYSAVKWTRGAFKRPEIACGVRYARRC